MFGHDTASTLAFETARQLSAPAQKLLCSSSAPANPLPLMRCRRPPVACLLATCRGGQRTSCCATPGGHGPRPPLRRRKETPTASTTMPMRSYVPLWRGYRPKERFNGPVVVVHSEFADPAALARVAAPGGRAVARDCEPISSQSPSKSAHPAPWRLPRNAAERQRTRSDGPAHSAQTAPNRLWLLRRRTWTGKCARPTARGPENHALEDHVEGRADPRRGVPAAAPRPRRDSPGMRRGRRRSVPRPRLRDPGRDRRPANGQDLVLPCWNPGGPRTRDGHRVRPTQGGPDLPDGHRRQERRRHAAAWNCSNISSASRLVSSPAVVLESSCRGC